MRALRVATLVIAFVLALAPGCAVFLRKGAYVFVHTAGRSGTASE